jgi:signal transduction histidine kinase
MIEERGLISALKNICALLGIPVQVHVEGRENLPSQIEYVLYKIGLEAIMNVAKHAGEQSLAEINLVRQAGHFDFAISDNGSGFDTVEAQHTISYGLGGMQRWADTIQAALDIQSMPAQGTTVRVSGLIPA